MVSNFVGSVGVGHILAGAAGLGAGMLANKRIAAFDQKVEQITRQALTDPAFAKTLLQNYNPKMPSTAGRKAMDFVQNRLAGIVAPVLNQENQ
jgi:hypothetical protein